MFAALNAVAQSFALSERLFDAWLWHESGVPTAHLAREKSRVYLVTTMISVQESVTEYLHLDTLCKPEGVWAQKLGVESMQEMIAYLEPEPKQRAWNALCGVTNGTNAPNVPMLRNRMERLPQTLSMETECPPLTLVSTQKRVEVESELSAVGAHMTQFFEENIR